MTYKIVEKDHPNGPSDEESDEHYITVGGQKFCWCWYDLDGWVDANCCHKPYSVSDDILDHMPPFEDYAHCIERIFDNYEGREIAWLG